VNAPQTKDGRPSPQKRIVTRTRRGPTGPATILGIPTSVLRRDMRTLLGRILRLWLSFIRGQLTLMFAVGLITWLGLLALGVPRAFFLGLVAAALEVVPNLGPTISTVLGVIVALLQGSNRLALSPPTLALVVFLFYVLVQQFENLVLVPRVMGDALKLPSLLVLAAVLLGGLVGGPVGAILATPMLASGREILRYIRQRRRNQDPFATAQVLP